ncbi:ABC transporter permease [Mangrovicoccus ximenensis]
MVPDLISRDRRKGAAPAGSCPAIDRRPVPVRDAAASAAEDALETGELPITGPAEDIRPPGVAARRWREHDRPAARGCHGAGLENRAARRRPWRGPGDLRTPRHPHRVPPRRGDRARLAGRRHADPRDGGMTGRLDRIGLLAVPALGVLAAVYALPLAMLLAKSVQTADGFSLAEYRAFFADEYNIRVLARTLRVAALTTLLAFVIAYPAAFAMSRAKGIWLTVFLVALVLPMSLGVVVKAFAWSILFRANGVLNSILMGIGLTERPVRMLFTETALIVGAANVFLPFMVLPIYSVVRQLDARLPEAAASLGATPWFRFTRVTLPLTLPGVVAGSAFVFSMSVSMYVIPSLIVGERQQNLPMLIARSFLYLRNEALGSTIAAILLAIAIAVVLLSGWAASRLGARR